MAEAFIHKNLAYKRNQIQTYIGSLERDLEQARRGLSAIVSALALTEGYNHGYAK